VGMFRRYLAIHMPTASVGMPPKNLAGKISPYLAFSAKIAILTNAGDR
jgi:hypothetical protein